MNKIALQHKATKIHQKKNSTICKSSSDPINIDPLLVRTCKGQECERTPVWLMRQAGRYMASFREYSDKYAFRMRSETPEIAIDLSLQPCHTFGTDAVIMFSDILTPLPALGIDFDIIASKGPIIKNPIKNIDQIKELKMLDDPMNSLSFINEILSNLRKEINKEIALIGFIGTPWTLAAYAIESKHTKDCLTTKRMMLHNPSILHALLDHLTNNLIIYVKYQIESGAQIIQLFDSWAHHLSPEQFRIFSLPYAEKILHEIKRSYPHIPLIFYMNGGTGKYDNFMNNSNADVIGLDWHIDISNAKQILNKKIIQGNVDPAILLGNQECIKEAVNGCMKKAGKNGHILNLGHGVIKSTPEENVKLFCDLAKESSRLFQEGLSPV